MVRRKMMKKKEGGRKEDVGEMRGDEDETNG